MPSWPEAAAGIRFSAEPSDHQFGDVLVEPISPDLCRVVVYTDPEERRLSWLTPSHLTGWGVSADDLGGAAATNMDALLAQTVRAVESAEPAEGMFPLIVLAQGRDDESPIAHAMLCELLASHGFVVATCPLVGTHSPLVSLDLVDLETQVRDLELVIGTALGRSGGSRAGPG